jgi:hypothetical protein
MYSGALISEGIVPADGIPRHLGISPRDVERLCHLRENYFDTPAEVLELATLRAARAVEKCPTILTAMLDLWCHPQNSKSKSGVRLEL